MNELEAIIKETGC